MRTYLYCEAGFVEKAQWLPNSWVNVVCPNNDDFEFLTKTLNVPESFLDDIADTDERPRTDTEGNWLLTILRIPVQNKQNENLPFGTVPIGIITNNEIIISVCYYNTDLLPDFIEHTRRKGIIVRNKLDLILRLIYSSAVWFLKYLKQINLDISAAEKELERSIRNEDLLRLMRLQKTLVYFNTSIRGNEVMIGKLKTIFQDTDYLDKELVEDVIIELKQALNTVNIYSDILTGTMDAFASIGVELHRTVADRGAVAGDTQPRFEIERQGVHQALFIGESHQRADYGVGRSAHAARFEGHVGDVHADAHAEDVIGMCRCAAHDGRQHREEKEFFHKIE